MKLYSNLSEFSVTENFISKKEEKSKKMKSRMGVAEFLFFARIALPRKVFK